LTTSYDGGETEGPQQRNRSDGELKDAVKDREKEVESRRVLPSLHW